MKIRKAVSQALALFEAGFPNFAVSAQAAGVWSAALERYTDDELERGAWDVLRYWRFGSPSIAAMVEAIEGRVEQRRRPRTDAFNNALPGQYEYHEICIGIDGRERGPRPALTEGDRSALPADIAGMLDGIAASAAAE